MWLELFAVFGVRRVVCRRRCGRGELPDDSLSWLLAHDVHELRARCPSGL